mgnify:CR=1 FL=1
MSEQKQENESRIPKPLTKEIEAFNDWLSEKTDSDKTLEDYTTYVRGFYTQSHERTGRKRPLELFTDKQVDEAKEEMRIYIGSRATEYGLKKYLSYLSNTRNTKEGRRAKYLKDEINELGKQKDNRSSLDKVGAKVRSESVIKDVIKYAPDRTNSLPAEELKYFLKLMYESAGRVGDVQRLEWRDIDRKGFRGQDLEKTEFVVKSDRSKSAEDGKVRMSESTLQWLQNHREKEDVDDSPTDSIFFQNSDTRKQNYRRIRRAVIGAGVDAGIIGKRDEATQEDWGTHNFRHSRLTHLGIEMLEDDERDLSKPEVKERLRKYGRHKNLEDTEVYIKIIDQRYQIDISKYFEEE